MKAQGIFILIVAAASLIILFQNMDVVSLRLLFWQVSVSRIVLLLGAIAVGFLSGFIAGRMSND